ncbi:MAG: NAD(P)H-hydrate dehydratase, partial [Gammaproteobacteria bacterium]|nr:NAD(P)H-hydrate dehydratase [Gammaproteobacteria bacterium]
LNLLSERGDSGAPLRRDNWILTPHPGEAASLLARSVADIQQDRFAAVEELYNRWGGCCLLKGSGSLICAGSRDGAEPIYLCTEGNAGMATGGMGDVLSGITAALVAQGLTLEQSLCCGVCIHGEAADLAMESGGQRGMVATDLFPFVRQLVNPAL